MPTTRTPVHRRSRPRISPEALAAFRVGDRKTLHHLLSLKPWQPSPCDVDDGPPPKYARGTAWGDTWPAAQAWRRGLEAAVSPIIPPRTED